MFTPISTGLRRCRRKNGGARITGQGNDIPGALRRPKAEDTLRDAREPIRRAKEEVAEGAGMETPLDRDVRNPRVLPPRLLSVKS